MARPLYHSLHVELGRCDQHAGVGPRAGSYQRVEDRWGSQRATIVNWALIVSVLARDAAVLAWQ
jgi:hypothetical protein